MKKIKKRSVAIDPSYAEFNKNVLFDPLSKWNRDDHLSPFHRLQKSSVNQAIEMNTADLVLNGEISGGEYDYYSFGILRDMSATKAIAGLQLKSFIIMEPPLVCPELYNALPEITKNFDSVYLHNTVGSGYSLKGVDRSKLKKLYWPQPYWGVLEKFWDNSNRLNRIVVINGNHRPKRSEGELYSERIFAMSALADLGVVDLYGRGWNRWWSRSSLWLPYWLNRRRLMSIYKGACDSKYEVLSRYKFCLCFENMQMSGYVTEKLFDCLFAGAIPLYLGAPDIDLLIPSNAFIDCRKFSSWQEMWAEINKVPEGELQKMRDAGREFLNSESYLPYYNSLEEIIDLNVA